jgi:hypothetical protein
MTVKDENIVLSIGEDYMLFVGTPKSFVIQSSNKDYAALAKENMNKSIQIPLIQGMPYVTFPTGRTTYLEITAALASPNPHQAIILTAPSEVFEALSAAKGTTVPGAIY